MPLNVIKITLARRDRCHSEPGGDAGTVTSSSADNLPLSSPTIFSILDLCEVLVLPLVACWCTFYSSTSILCQGYQTHAEKVEFSGPLMSQSRRVEELLERHERHIRQAVRKSWFQRGTFFLSP